MTRNAALFALFFLCAAALYARGKKDAAPPAPRDPEWTLVVTRAGDERLPRARAAAAGVWNRYLYQALLYVRYRARLSGEAEYYTYAEWLKAQTAAAAPVRAKQNERDLLYFKGLSASQYKRQVKTIDADIEKLRAALKEAEDAPPAIEGRPKFVVKGPDAAGAFTPPPGAGGEALFCAGRKADAFVSSELSVYHERVYIELKLWTLYSKSYSYTDGVLFSIEDMAEASAELCGRLIDAMTGVFPTSVRVAATPPESVIVVGGAFAGTGESADIPRSPGEVDISVFAPGYETAAATVDLAEGERTSVTLDLRPVPNVGVPVAVRGGEEASAYSGALYVGKTPLLITDNADKNMNVNVISADGRTAGTVFKISERPVTLAPRTPPEKGRVEKARKGFYGAWGRFWIVLPAMWLAVGLSDAFVNGYNTAGGGRTPENLETVNKYYWTAGALGALTGVILAESLGRFFWYGHQASKPATPLDPPPPPARREAAVARAFEEIAPAGKRRKQAFTLTATDRGEIASWRFAVLPAEGDAAEPVFERRGKKAPPKTLSWNGRLASGGVASGGFAGELELTYENGATARARSAAFAVAGPPPPPGAEPKEPAGEAAAGEADPPP